MRRLIAALIVAASLLLPAVPASAHNSTTHCDAAAFAVGGRAYFVFENNQGAHVDCRFIGHIYCRRSSGSTYTLSTGWYRLVSTGQWATSKRCYSGHTRYWQSVGYYAIQ